MTKFLAKLAVFAGVMGCMLGQYWFTFGLWPKSWGSFVLFSVLQIVLMLVSLAVDAEAKS